ncbi:MAG: phosphodiester glycosidase family protein [Caldilineales bacterium]|nr:phosphodiester glycosidase family protein [Caldilineales bacterium]
MRYLLLILLLLAACTPPASDEPPATATRPRPSPTRTPRPTPIPTRPAQSDDEWQSAFPGAEILQTEDGILAIRHAPTAVDYDHRFEPGLLDGEFISGWLEQKGRATAAVNCGFFQESEGAYRHIGLLMTNGEQSARLRSNWGGVLIVRNGEAFVVRRPQRLLAPADLGIQGWPMLLEGGSALPRLNDVDPARRTAVGVDGAGRVVWLATAQQITLADFAEQLQHPKLGLIDAINLDGGSSTGLKWRANPNVSQSGIESLPVPCAILLSPI